MEVFAGRKRGAIGLGMAGMLALLALIAISSPATSEAFDHAVSKRDVAKRLTKRLANRDFVTLEKPACKSRRNGARFTCAWRAEGHPKGQVPFECEGKARFQVEGERWRIKRCKDRLITLLPDLGPHPEFGYNEDWYARGGLEMAASGGAEIVRQEVVWSRVELIRDQYQWYPYDVLYQRMLAAGVRPLWVLGSPPCWAQAPEPPQLAAPCVYNPGPPTPENYSQLGELAALLADRYPQSVGIEVWNEPNYRPHWGADPDPEAYGALTKEVATAILAANSYMPVVSAGLAPLSTNGSEGMAYEQLLEEGLRDRRPPANLRDRRPSLSAWQLSAGLSRRHPCEPLSASRGNESIWRCDKADLGDRDGRFQLRG